MPHASHPPCALPSFTYVPRSLSLQAALHLIAADEVKHATGFQNLTSDAFASFNTLIGLVFSILLGQTYAADPDR